LVYFSTKNGRKWSIIEGFRRKKKKKKVVFDEGEKKKLMNPSAKSSGERSRSMFLVLFDAKNGLWGVFSIKNGRKMAGNGRLLRVFRRFWVGKKKKKKKKKWFLTREKNGIRALKARERGQEAWFCCFLMRKTGFGAFFQLKMAEKWPEMVDY
jgi:hypothetical protein